ncbi:MAG: transcriptional regulator [Bacillales bacterium]|jgi:prespore-specific regulator|nr:transcriptional regulator [Bacillales bacterium]
MKLRQDAWSDENDLLLAETVLRHVREGSTQLNAFEEVGDILNRTSAACGFRWNAVVRHKYEKALQLAKKFRKDKKRAYTAPTTVKVKKNLLYTPAVNTTFHTSEQLNPVVESYEQNNAQVNYAVNDYNNEVSNELTIPLNNDRVQPSFQSDRQLPNNSLNGGNLTIDEVIQYLRTLKVQTAQDSMLQYENSRLARENNNLKNMVEDLQNRVKTLEAEATSMHEDYDTLMKILNRARKLVLFEEEDRATTAFKMDKNGNLEKVAE